MQWQRAGQNGQIYGRLTAETTSKTPVFPAVLGHGRASSGHIFRDYHFLKIVLNTESKFFFLNNKRFLHSLMFLMLAFYAKLETIIS